MPKLEPPSAEDELPGTRARVELDIDGAAFAIAKDKGNARMLQLLQLRDEAGLDPSAAIFIPFTAALDATALPQTATASLAKDSKVQLVVVDSKSPHKGKRLPVEVSFKAAAETYTPANTLVVLPLQGVVPDFGVTHAVIVRRSLKDADGELLGSPAVMQTLKAGAWKELLTNSGVPLDDIATAYVFTPQDPTAKLRAIREHVAKLPLPALTGLKLSRKHEKFCVIEAKTTLPALQLGPKPYTAAGTGHIVVGEDGAPVVQGQDAIPIVFSVPRKPMPDGGFPIVIYGNGGGGKATQVIDRNQEPGGPQQGHGPARQLGHHGVAAVGFPAPLAWERNPSGGEGTFNFWNINNLAAFRDNVRQGALDFATVFRIVENTEIPGDLCPDAKAKTVTFNAAKRYLWGHSTGSTVGSIAAVLERPAAVVLSGAGGSWIYNLAMADSPVVYRKIVGGLIGYDDGDKVDRFDYALSVFQHAMSGIEVMSWGHLRRRDPTYAQAQDMLLIEGVEDSYHYPRMVHAYAMSADLDLAGPPVEETGKLEFPLVGGALKATPVSGNRTGKSRSFTAITLQRQAREGIDGHYVPFAWPDVKRQWACFFAEAAQSGVAKLVKGDDPDALAACK